MLDEALTDDTLVQILADVGFCAEEIARFLSCCRQESQVARLQILNEYRGKLLGTVQDNQEKLYRLDYLIRKLKTQNI